MKKLLLILAALALALGSPGHSQEVDLRQFVGSDNAFADAAHGISLTLPAGLEVVACARWGEGRNTFHLRPVWPSKVTPSIYYQDYRNGSPPPSGNLEAYFHNLARKKAESRVQGMRDYRNDPGSFFFKMINGRPSCSYVATFTKGRKKMAEYFVRVAGRETHVMFFTVGPAKEIAEIRAEIDKMAETVRVP